MANEKEYYTEDISKLRQRVDNCNIDVLDSIEFFLGEANAYTTGISDDIVKQINEEVKRYKKYCRCEKKYP